MLGEETEGDSTANRTVEKTGDDAVREVFSRFLEACEWGRRGKGGVRRIEKNGNAPFARMGILSRCSSTICAIASHSLSLSSRVLISGTAAKVVNAEE